MEPWRFSLRELLVMAHARIKERWNHTAQIVATILEVNRDKKKRSTPITAAECHPYHRQRGGRGVPFTKELLRAQARQYFAEQAAKQAAQQKAADGPAADHRG